MRVPLEWLREYCDAGTEAEAIAERLTMTGTKVEAIHHHGPRAVDRFVVGRVLAVDPHPDAQRLTVCRVDVGTSEAAQIVCGAPNVAAGLLVAVARPGAVMPDGSELRAVKLRGVRSEGMILAEDELGLGVDHAGVIDLLAEPGLDSSGLVPGQPLVESLAAASGRRLALATEVLELEITSNRPDCLGVYGVARELHAATGAELASPPWARDAGSPGPVGGVEVLVECPELCPRFTARVFEGVRIGPSPMWLKGRLLAAGQRPINNLVDITNYVMLATGQPLHAFDLDRVAGGRLTVRRARAGELVRTLDGHERELDEETVVICDDDGPTSIAGIMGGASSEVGPDTTRVALESASWVAANIHRTEIAMGLRSEAGARFEKGLAPEQALEAQALASELIPKLCGGRLLAGTVDVAGAGWPAPPARPIRLRGQRVAGVLGRAIARSRQSEILGRLEFGVEEVDDGLDVTVPHFRRGEVTREIDLVEEVARIDGLDQIPATLPWRRGAAGRLTTEQRLRRRAVDALVGRGLYEIAGWSFSSQAMLDRLRLPKGDPRRSVVSLVNPLSAERAVMRTTLLGSLLEAASRNRAQQIEDIRIFEVGNVYLAQDEPLPRERSMLGALLSGSVLGPSWRESHSARFDFFAGKALVEALAQALRVDELRVEAARQPFLHPGRSALVSAAGRELGWLGELHPLLARDWDLPDGVAFELDLGALTDCAAVEPIYRDVMGYPALREDLAVTISQEVSAARVVAVVRGAGGELLDGVRIFDVYEGPQVGRGRRSLALSLSYRAGDRTLADEDVAPLRARIVAALAHELGGEFRG